MTIPVLKSTNLRSRVEPALQERTTNDHAQCDLHFEIKIPNAQTIAAMNEARDMTKARFYSAEEMFDALERTSRPKAR